MVVPRSAASQVSSTRGRVRCGEEGSIAGLVDDMGRGEAAQGEDGCGGAKEHNKPCELGGMGREETAQQEEE